MLHCLPPLLTVPQVLHPLFEVYMSAFLSGPFLGVLGNAVCTACEEVAAVMASVGNWALRFL